jgi:hypothetical protein
MTSKRPVMNSNELVNHKKPIACCHASLPCNITAHANLPMQVIPSPLDLLYMFIFGVIYTMYALSQA